MPPVAAATTTGTIGRRSAAVVFCRPGLWRCMTMKGMLIQVAMERKASTHQKAHARYITHVPQEVQQKIIMLIMAEAC